MLKFFPALALLCALCACSTVLADNPKNIDLSGAEKSKAVAISEHRQAIFLKRQELDARYQSDVHRLDEELQEVNIETGKFCFELKKAHKLSPSADYVLDEVNAQLVKR